VIAYGQPRCCRSRRHRLRRLLQLPPPPRRARLEDAGRTVRRDAVHRLGLWQRAPWPMSPSSSRQSWRR